MIPVRHSSRLVIEFWANILGAGILPKLELAPPTAHTALLCNQSGKVWFSVRSSFPVRLLWSVIIKWQLKNGIRSVLGDLWTTITLCSTPSFGTRTPPWPKPPTSLPGRWNRWNPLRQPTSRINSRKAICRHNFWSCKLDFFWIIWSCIRSKIFFKKKLKKIDFFDFPGEARRQIELSPITWGNGIREELAALPNRNVGAKIDVFSVKKLIS